MCGDCGCQEANMVHFPQAPKNLANLKTIKLDLNILGENNRIADENQHWFSKHKVPVVNFMSSPGSGKTMLLEKTIPYFSKAKLLVGDQQTDNDQQRLAKAGGVAKQISTYGTCHLDAKMIANELNDFVTGEEDLLFIENVGNLVCPTAFDLGESHKVALLSVTEGEDKPEKYPVLFNQADIVLLTKIDLLPHLDWDQAFFEDCLAKVNPQARVLQISAKTGEGMNHWIDFLQTVKGQ